MNNASSSCFRLLLLPAITLTFRLPLLSHPRRLPCPLYLRLLLLSRITSFRSTSTLLSISYFRSSVGLGLLLSFILGRTGILLVVTGFIG